MPGDGVLFEVKPDRGRESEDSQEQEMGAREQAVHQCSGAARDGDDSLRDDCDQEG